MKLVKEGPDIPVDIIQKLEDGKLIFFCGAGVSYPAKLPSFKGLVEKIYEKIHVDMAQDELQSFEAGHYDRTLALLENRIDSSLIREKLSEILEIEAPIRNKLDTHKAILSLSRFNDGSRRLVTTNFDRGFIKACDENLPVDPAPKLPVPKNHAWNSLVHLHGLIQDIDPEGKALVVTSADFGAAYLTERWASRFVSELFRRYHVVFIGYSIEDTVIRYMMDALAADRRKGDEQAKVGYVFAPSTAWKMKESAREWKAKSVEPILYNKKENHKLLHQTLKAWAELHRDGIVGKESIIQRYSMTKPLSLYDESVGQVIWALSEPSGHIADVFAKLDPDPPPIEWLEKLDESGLFNMPEHSNGNTPGAAIVDNGFTTVRPESLSKVTRHLGFWLTRHLENIVLLRWVIKKGGCLHPDMRELIQNELKKSTIKKELKLVWQLLSSEMYVCKSRGMFDWYDLESIIKSTGWNPILKQKLLNLFRPKLHFSLPWQIPHSHEQIVEKTVKKINDLVETNIKLSAGESIHTLTEDLKKLENSDQILSELLDGLTSRLVEIWDLRSVLGDAGEKSDFSYINQPSITEHDQNHGFEDWTKLIVLIREAFYVSFRVDPAKAKAVVERWKTIRYPIFRRLVLFAMAESDLYTPERSLSYILKENNWWLWSVETKRETFRLLNHIAPKLKQNSINKLCESIIAGMPHEMFKEGISKSRFQEVNNHAQWLLLMKLDELNVSLPSEAKKVLFELGVFGDTLRGNDQDEFPFLMESSSGYKTDFTVDQLGAMDVYDLSNLLLTEQKNREGLLDLFRSLTKKDREISFLVVEILSNQEKWIEDVWHSMLNGLNGIKEDFYIESWERLSSLLLNAPENFIKETARPISWWMRDVTKKIEIQDEKIFWKLWDRFIDIVLTIDPGEFDDPVSIALNDPAGLLTESFLDRIWARKPKVGDGFDDAIKKRISNLCKGKEKSHSLCRVILASRLHVLFSIDVKWAKANLIPYFNWDKSDEAINLWKGYLWAPRVSPDLVSVLKKSLIKTLMKKNILGNYTDRICQLFTLCSLIYPKSFTHREIRDLLLKTDADGRAEILDSLQKQVFAAAKDSGSFWINRVEPWIESSWPKDLKFIDQKTSKSFALAAIGAGSEFERAVGVALKYIKEIEEPSIVIYRLNSMKVADKQLVPSFPSSALKLMNAIISDQSKWPGPTWRDVLDQIGSADKSLIATDYYKRIDEFLRKKGK